MAVYLYFASTLLIGVLCGLMAVFVWHRRQVPGARPYTAILGCACLLTVVELLVMLSARPELALCWWKMRFLFSAALPVLWLVFVFQYGDWPGGRSKRLLAGMFAIPLLTQVLLWTNDLHGLWVRQDVGWRQSGPYWIADTSVRIPGPWFVVYSFYGSMLWLAGVGFLLVAAWGMRQIHMRRALLIAATALMVLLNAVIPSFKLLSQLEFNFFSLGTGAGLLVIGLLCFGGKWAPVPTVETRTHGGTVSPLASWVWISVLVMTTVLSGGYWFFLKEADRIRQEKHEQLAAIGKLKVDQIVAWRREQIARARIHSTESIIRVDVLQMLQNPADPAPKTRLESRAKLLAEIYGYRNIMLADPAANILLSLDPRITALDEEPKRVVAWAMTSASPVIGEPYRCSICSKVHLDVAATVRGSDGRAVAVLLLRSDPHDSLYPLMTAWPTPSRTAETLLVRRDGDDVQFLSERRYESGAELTRRNLMRQPDLPAAQAVQGRTGEFEGKDYRGVPVLADLRPISGSSWFLIAKVDSAELLAEVRYRGWVTAGAVAICAAITAGITGLVGMERRRREETLRQRDEKQRVERELAEVRGDLVRVTRLAAIGQISATIAHDLRNPLGAARNAVFFLKRKAPADPPILGEYLNIIEQEIDAADRIIGNLMSMARVKEIHMHPVDLRTLVDEEYRRLCSKGSVALEWRLNPDPFVVSADLESLRQVVRNLMQNAAEAMDGAGTITVEGRRDGPDHVIVFRDSGAGVPAQVRETLFEPLVSTKIKGIGLGLTICRQIIERHGGNIDLLEGPERGAAFRIRLPVDLRKEHCL